MKPVEDGGEGGGALWLDGAGELAGGELPDRSESAGGAQVYLLYNW